MSNFVVALILGAVAAVSFVVASQLSRRIFPTSDSFASMATFGLGLGLMVLLGAAVIAASIYIDNRRISRFSAEQAAKKAEFMRKLCEDRRAKGEPTGLGCPGP
jgi:hypothetical protein